jgi:hypothetical protein
MLSYEEARKQDTRVDSWMLLAENAALSAHGSICEDGPELPKEEGQEGAQEGGESLEGMYAPGCESLEQARILRSPGAGIGDEPVGECTGELGGRNRHPERLRVACKPARPLGSLTSCSDDSFAVPP